MRRGDAFSLTAAHPPTSVHRWNLDVPYTATLMLLRPLDGQREWRPGPNIISLSPAERADLEPILALARCGAQSPLFSARSIDLVRELVASTLGLDRPDTTGASEASIIYAEFRRMIAVEEAEHRTVADYARRLGCSTRTLARVCSAANARPPKQLIDEAVLLSAKRRLTLPHATVAAVGEALGFVDPSNFSRFFLRTAGETPSSWLARVHAGEQPQLTTR